MVFSDRTASHTHSMWTVKTHAGRVSQRDWRVSTRPLSVPLMSRCQQHSKDNDTTAMPRADVSWQPGTRRFNIRLLLAGKQTGLVHDADSFVECVLSDRTFASSRTPAPKPPSQTSAPWLACWVIWLLLHTYGLRSGLGAKVSFWG